VKADRSAGRWIIASNRLPFTRSNGKVVVSSGGLVSALSGVRVPRDTLWVGTAASELSREELNRSRAGRLLARFVPIHVEENDYDRYYNGISNNVFWPAFHYQSQYVNFSWEDWKAYLRVNERFARTILAEAGPDDLIWIHDFHLFMVPHFLRKMDVSSRMGFFLHIPFPTSEIFRELPVREEVLASLLEADLVGFHDHGYLNHFLSASRRILGLETSLLGIRRGAHTTRLGVFPVSIDTRRYEQKAREARVRQLTEKFRIGGRRYQVILGVDRLDYAKGIDLKLRAFREMLVRHPNLRGHVTLIQVAVPTRQRVPNYQTLRSRVQMMVGEINGQFGRPNHTPVKYLYGGVSMETLLALYRLADVMVVSSKRDGMNLVCQEYVAAQDPENPGVLLLSEFAGAISTLSHAVPINPWDIDRTAEKLAEALRVPRRTRQQHHARMLDYLKAYTASDWAGSFMTALRLRVEATPEPPADGAETLHPKRLPKALETRLRKSRLRLLTDYDGTLSPIRETPREAVLDRTTRAVLRRIATNDAIRMITVSGRPSRFLTEQFRGIGISLAAEHGARFFSASRRRWQSLVHSDRTQWMGTAREIMESYATRVPGSFVERKAYSVSWHYRKSPEDFATLLSRKLREELESIFVNLPVSVLRGKKVIEIRAAEANKGHFVRWWLDTFPLADDEVVVALGDDETDEEMFEALPSSAITIKVGTGPTSARYRILQQERVGPFLARIADLAAR
jgi:trehalose 6-phosphate synthase/phosphatase